jgi:hypothetical protein
MYYMDEAKVVDETMYALYDKRLKTINRVTPPIKEHSMTKLHKGHIFTDSIFDVEGKDLPHYTRKELKKQEWSLSERIIISFLLLAFLYFGAHVVVFIAQTYGG